MAENEADPADFISVYVGNAVLDGDPTRRSATMARCRKRCRGAAASTKAAAIAR
jgi:hypothetical protein